MPQIGRTAQVHKRTSRRINAPAELLTSSRVGQAVLDELDSSVHLLLAADVQLDDPHALRLKLLQLLGTFSASILQMERFPCDPKNSLDDVQWHDHASPGGTPRTSLTYLKQTSGEDGEAEGVQMLGQGMAEPGVTACN